MAPAPFTPDGVSSVTISTPAIGAGAQLYSYNSTMNFAAMPTDWAAQIVFKMTGNLVSNNNDVGAGKLRQWTVFSGEDHAENSNSGIRSASDDQQRWHEVRPGVVWFR